MLFDRQAVKAVKGRQGQILTAKPAENCGEWLCCQESIYKNNIYTTYLLPSLSQKGLTADTGPHCGGFLRGMLSFDSLLTFDGGSQRQYIEPLTRDMRSDGVGMSNFQDKWIILRTSGRKTLPLSLSLRDAGFDAWTPATVVHRRIPRAKTKREIDAPVMPTFVFARAKDAADLLSLSQDSTTRHPSFSVFHHMGRIPVIADYEIEPLRKAERKPQPQPIRRVFSKGEAVHVPNGAFHGLAGVVEEADGRYVLVCFGRTKVKISTFLLQPNKADDVQPLTGAAARAA